MVFIPSYFQDILWVWNVEELLHRGFLLPPRYFTSLPFAWEEYKQSSLVPHSLVFAVQPVCLLVRLWRSPSLCIPH